MSFLAAGVVIALTVLNFTVLRDRNTVAQSVLTCLIGLVIPVIGWMGARASNRNMVGIFCAFSLSCAIFNLISYIVVMVSISYLYTYLNECLPNGTVIIDGNVNTHICHDYTLTQARNMFIIASCISVPVIFLQCMGAIYGNKLYSHLTPGVIITYQEEAYQGQAYATGTVVAGPPIVVEAYPQPAGIYPRV